jgi:predicted metal-dependent hydrolase
MISAESIAGFEEGIRRFNQGEFFEAHEVWEHQWRRAEGAERVFLQGLIQAAVALCHLRRSNYRGAVSVYRKSRAHLSEFPALWMGIELGQFRSELEQYFAAWQSGLGAVAGNCQSTQTSDADSRALPTIRRAGSGEHAVDEA